MIRKIWQILKPIFFEDEAAQHVKDQGKLGFLHWILLLACIGLAAMILHNYFSIQDEVLPTTSPTSNHEPSTTPSAEESIETIGATHNSPKSMREYEEFFENKLKDILSTIEGVGEVAVFVNLESTEEVVYERNIRTQVTTTNEQDREGGSRNNEDQLKDEQVVVIRGENGDEPIISMKKKPQVRGVVIVADGASNIQVKVWIAEAVQRVLDVPLHKISVLPKKKLGGILNGFKKTNSMVTHNA